MSVAILTDSNSGITQFEASSLGVSVLPMPIMLADQIYYEDINLSQDEFYTMLREDVEVRTSQPAVGDVIDRFDELLKQYDEVVYIPMSGGLSGACQTGKMLAEDYSGRVQVVDNHRISVTLRRSVMDAVALAKAGVAAAEIKKILEESAGRSSIYIMVDTMKYLKKGGRVTPTAAMIGAVLNIKPVLQIQGGKLDAFAKVRGEKAATDAMIQAMKHDFETRFAAANAERRMHLYVAHTQNEEKAATFAKEIEAAFPGYAVKINPLSLSVSCHIGPGSLAIACSEKIV
ncbi:MAG: DegV family protein [Clostridia bacterium]|nr:DegV family protein [Clostridia bacterium]